MYIVVIELLFFMISISLFKIFQVFAWIFVIPMFVCLIKLIRRLI